MGAGVAIVALTTSALVPSSAARAESVASDRPQLARLERAIATKDAEIEALVEKVKPARARLAALHDEISHDEQLLATRTGATRTAQTFARRLAANAFVGPTNPVRVSPFFDNKSPITQVTRARHALDAVKSHLDDSITKLEFARRRTDDRREQTKQRVDAQRALDQLTRVQADATAAITAEKATLTRVSADLTARLVHRKLHKEAQALRSSHQAIVAVLTAATKKNSALPNARRPVSRSNRASRRLRRIARPAPRSPYKNPLRSVSGLIPERVDQGVDYGGVGPVYAIGNGVVLTVYASGWPNGVYIAYQLSDGPAKGLIVFTAEDLNPQVSVGSQVTANTVIGTMFGGPHGIEIGWADGSTMPNTLARSYGQYYGGNSTAFGYNFSRLLQSVGGPGGVVKNEPTGTLPAGWPQW